MLDVINLALPFFGLIFLGLACGSCSQASGGRLVQAGTSASVASY